MQLLTSFLRMIYIDLLIFLVSECNNLRANINVSLISLVKVTLMSLCNVFISTLFSISKCALK